MERALQRNLDSSTQTYLLDLWSAQLNHPGITPEADFFDAGGSSMQLIEMLVTVADKFGKEIDYAEFLEKPNISRLTELLER